MANITLADAKLQLERHYYDSLPDVSDTLFEDWANIINQFVYRELVQIDPERYITTTTITTTPGVSQYALPADFERMGDGQCGLFIEDGNGLPTDRRLKVTSYGSPSTGYYVDSSNIVFTPQPQEAKQYFFRYIPELAEVDINDSFIIPTQYRSYILQALIVQFESWDNNSGEEVFEDQKFVRVMEELLANFRRDSEIFSIDSIVNNY
jgi:hypothetical protein